METWQLNLWILLGSFVLALCLHEHRVCAHTGSQNEKLHRVTKGIYLGALQYSPGIWVNFPCVIVSHSVVYSGADIAFANEVA